MVTSGQRPAEKEKLVRHSCPRDPSFAKLFEIDDFLSKGKRQRKRERVCRARLGARPSDSRTKRAKEVEEEEGGEKKKKEGAEER